METAVAAALRSLETAVAALGGEHRSEDPGGWAGAATEVADASRSLRERWRHLEPRSPYRDVAQEAADLLGAAVRGMAPAAPPDRIAQEAAQWTRLVAGRQAAISIREARSRLGISLREAARRSALAAGHLSELEEGQRSLLSVSTAQKLDSALGTDLASLLGTLRQRPGRPPSARRRAAGVTTAPIVSFGVDPDLDAILSKVAADARLVQLNEDVLRLPAATRRGLAQMVRAMVSDLAGSAAQR